MKRFIFYWGILMLVILSVVNANATPNPIEEVIEKGFDLESAGTFSLTNVAGNIDINSWNKEEVRMIASKSISSWGTDNPEELLNKIKIEVTSQKKNLRIHTRYPTLSGIKNARVDYQLWIPETVRVQVESVSGMIHMEKHLNQIYAKTVSGGIKLNNIEGFVEVKTVSGKISASQIKGDIKASSVSGNLVFRDCEGIFSDLHSTSGDIEAELLSLDEDASGMSLSTVSGEISLYLPNDASFDLRIKSVSGEINTKFKVLVENMKRNQLTGKVGAGGLNVELRTISGDIFLGRF